MLFLSRILKPRVEISRVGAVSGNLRVLTLSEVRKWHGVEKLIFGPCHFEIRLVGREGRHIYIFFKAICSKSFHIEHFSTFPNTVHLKSRHSLTQLMNSVIQWICVGLCQSVKGLHFPLAWAFHGRFLYVKYLVYPCILYVKKPFIILNVK